MWGILGQFIAYLLTIAGVVLWMLLILTHHWMAWLVVLLLLLVVVLPIVVGIGAGLGKPWALKAYRWIIWPRR
jgi:fatty-acid desaturase